jgi:hypothetical protein
MSALSDYYDLLLPELPGCLPSMVDLHLRDVAREFCEKTSIWREDLTAIDLAAEQAAYVVATPDLSAMVRVLSVTVADVLLWKDRPVGECDDESKYRPDEPPFTLSADLTTLTLATDEVPTASLVGGLVITAALKPTAVAATLPDFLLSQWSEAIRAGVLSRLMVMGKKPWTDRELAGFYASTWNSQLNKAAYQGQVGNTRKQLRVRKWG